ncbi:MAG: segregation/condensation protein A [Patescibacteria group bacterium]
MSYELKLPQFTGPLPKLLELIEERKMEVTNISLAQVTDDFLKYLKTLTEERADLRLIADFISVASRLIFIKSKFLLPELDLTPEEEGAAKDLELRLRLYQQLKPIIAGMLRLWKTSGGEWSRPFLLDRGVFSLPPGQTVFYPGHGISLNDLTESLEKIFESFAAIAPETESIKEKIVSIEEKIQEIIQRLEKEGGSTFKNLSSAKSRKDVIVIFLAILHLAREQLIYIEQTGHLSDIIIMTNEI